MALQSERCCHFVLCARQVKERSFRLKEQCAQLWVGTGSTTGSEDTPRSEGMERSARAAAEEPSRLSRCQIRSRSSPCRIRSTRGARSTQSSASCYTTTATGSQTRRCGDSLWEWLLLSCTLEKLSESSSSTRTPPTSRLSPGKQAFICSEAMATQALCPAMINISTSTKDPWATCWTTSTTQRYRL